MQRAPPGSPTSTRPPGQLRAAWLAGEGQLAAVRSPHVKPAAALLALYKYCSYCGHDSFRGYLCLPLRLSSAIILRSTALCSCAATR